VLTAQLDAAIATIRPAQNRDRAAVRRVHRAAYGRDGEADLVGQLWDRRLVPPGLSQVAERDGEVVGHVLLSEVRLGDYGVLALAPLGVLPQYRGHGIGSALVRAALDAARRSTYGLVLVLGDPRYYGRFGFVPAAELGVHDPFGVLPGVYQGLRLPNWGRELTGSPIYPEPFSRL